MKKRACSGIGLSALFLLACSTAPGGLSPEEALQTFQIQPGFRIELFASEPLISDPVAMDIDEMGRIYVVEMPGYPLDTQPTGRVRLLEDTDGDGLPDQSRIFADELVLPSGVMRWGEGILVTAAPEVIYLEDEDGDGLVDQRKTILTGFAFTNPQHTVNNPIYGPDNWIYLAHEGPAGAVIFQQEFGDRGEVIRYVDRPEGSRLEPRRLSVRFKPSTGQLEYLSSSSQFGHSFDLWGNYLTADNSNHVRHEVIAARYLERNPLLPLRSAMRDVSDHGSAGRVYPITENPRIELLTEYGQFTSACGLTAYSGGLFPEAYRQATFVAEPVHNLVHVDLWSREGASFTARRLEADREFLASTDPWFRPVNFYNAPDGSLYVIDYYRQMVEHPEWTSSEHHHQDDPSLYQGNQRGRIYRIVPEPAGPPASFPDLSHAEAEQLARLLGHPNGWQRRTAQRLLVERGDRAVIPLLREAWTKPGTSGLQRLHLLWSLEGLNGLSEQILAGALQDPEPEIRRTAVVLAEQRMREFPSLAGAFQEMAEDGSASVRFQLLLTLGGMGTNMAKRLQGRLLKQDFEDSWVQMAALTAGPTRAVELLGKELRRGKGLNSEAGRSFFEKAAAVIAASDNPTDIGKLLDLIEAGVDQAWGGDALKGLAYGSRFSEKASFAGERMQRSLAKLYRRPSLRDRLLDLFEVVGLPGSRLSAELEQARILAKDTSSQPRDRVQSIRLLGLSRSAVPFVELQNLVTPAEPESVQAAAITVLGKFQDEPVGEFLLARWRQFTPETRSAAAEVLLHHPRWVRELVNALRDGRVQPWSMDFWEKRDLIMHDDEEIRALSREILERTPKEQASVLQKYLAGLDEPADPSRGKPVFTRVCSQCHRLYGEGSQVGPDLETVRNRPAARLMREILLPSETIAQSYESYVVQRISGGTEEGVLGSSGSQAVVLRMEGAEEAVIPRSDIARMYVSEVSSMPSDLSDQISVQEMVDLIEYIRRGDRPRRSEAPLRER